MIAETRILRSHVHGDQKFARFKITFHLYFRINYAIIKKKIQLLPNVLIGYWQDLYFANTLQDDDFKDNFFYQNNLRLEKE
jgi:hypothetical protein